MEYELSVANDILFLAFKYSLSSSTDTAELVINTFKASFPILRRYFYTRSWSNKTGGFTSGSFSGCIPSLAGKNLEIALKNNKFKIFLHLVE